MSESWEVHWRAPPKPLAKQLLQRSKPTTRKSRQRYRPIRWGPQLWERTAKLLASSYRVVKKRPLDLRRLWAHCWIELHRTPNLDGRKLLKLFLHLHPRPPRRRSRD